MLNFKTEFANVVDVSYNKIHCFAQDGEVNEETIRKYGGWARDSYLCYIGFMSKVNPENKKFMLAFRVKAHSKNVRNNAMNQSKWFLIFKDATSNNNDFEILDKDFSKIVFDFDVDKFFETDYFQGCVETFKKIISAGIEKINDVIAENPRAMYSVGDCIRGIHKGLIDLDNPPVFNNGKTYRAVEDPNLKYGFNDPVKMANMEKFMRKQAEKDAANAISRNARQRTITED